MAGRKHAIKRLDGKFVLISTNPFGHVFSKTFDKREQAEEHRKLLIRLEKGDIR